MTKLLAMHKTLGVAFLLLLLAAAYLTYGIFSKQFVTYEEVALQTSKIGLQLPERADVKIRGVIVGEVLAFEPTEDGAEVTLGLYPDQVDIIPENVTGAILPKTLFGEKYVSLVVPPEPSSEHITAADTVEQTAVATEVEEVLNDLYPLLRTVQPAELNMTLNALSTALEGRGEQVGETIEVTDAYLRKINPEIPLFIDDLRLASETSDIYADVLPELGTILDNTVITTGTLEDREAKLQALFNDVASFSDTTRTFLRDNGDNLVRSGELGAASFRVLAKYSPEFPCLLGGVVNSGKGQAEAFRNFTLHIVLETIPNQPRGYTPADRPRVGDKRGPNCLNLPNPPGSQANPFNDIPNFDDGVDEPTGKGTTRVAPSYWLRDGMGFAGSREESDVLKGLLAPGMGVPTTDVGDLGPLLVAPMARGAKVGLR